MRKTIYANRMTFFQLYDLLGGVVINCPPGVPKVVGSIPDRVIPKTLKMEIMAAHLGALGSGVIITTDG